MPGMGAVRYRKPGSWCCRSFVVRGRGTTSARRDVVANIVCEVPVNRAVGRDWLVEVGSVKCQSTEIALIDFGSATQLVRRDVPKEWERYGVKGMIKEPMKPYQAMHEACQCYEVSLEMQLAGDIKTPISFLMR